jgi:hypothetical protein
MQCNDITLISSINKSVPDKKEHQESTAREHNASRPTGHQHASVNIFI